MSIEEKITLMFEGMSDYDRQLILVGRLQAIAHRNYEKDKIEQGRQLEMSRAARRGSVIRFSGMERSAAR